MHYFVHGLSKSGTRYIREPEVFAESQADAMRKVRAMHPDAGSLSCRGPDHAGAVLELLADRPVQERAAA